MTVIKHIVKFPDGKIKSESWRDSDTHLLYNIDGPAQITYHENGQKHMEKWAINNIIYRLDTSKPAFTIWKEDGSTSYMCWYDIPNVSELEILSKNMQKRINYQIMMQTQWESIKPIYYYCDQVGIGKINKSVTFFNNRHTEVFFEKGRKIRELFFKSNGELEHERNYN